MPTDDELRARLIERTQETLLDEYDREYDASHLNLGDFRLEAERSVDALMPVVREALAEQWDEGFRTGRYSDYPANPWRQP